MICYAGAVGLLTLKHAFAAIRLNHISLTKCVRNVPAVGNKARDIY